MDKFWAIWGAVRAVVARFVPWGTAKLLFLAVGITAFAVWGLTAAGCNKWHVGRQDAAWAQGC